MRVAGTKSDMTFVLALLALSLGLNIYLARRAFAPMSAPAPELLAKGQVAPALTVTGLDGQMTTLSYNDKPTVLYVFTPSCPWCQRNLPNILQLAATSGSRFRFVGLSLDETGLAAYVDEHHLPFPVYTKVSNDARSRYRLGGVPQTMVISERGIVVENWAGAYIG